MGALAPDRLRQAEARGMTMQDRELIEAWRAVANAKLVEFRRQCWRLAMLNGQTFVQKLLVESECRMPQRQDDFCS